MSILYTRVYDKGVNICNICKTQIYIQTLIDVQSSNWRPILKYLAVFHFIKSTSKYVTLTYASNDITTVRTWF